MANLLLLAESDDRGVCRTVNGREGHRTFKQVWDATPTTKEIEQAAGMPVIGDPHPDFPEMAVYKIGESDNKDLRIYFVPVYYSSIRDTTSNQDETSPLDDPWDVSLGAESQEKAVDKTTLDLSALTGGDEIGLAADKVIATTANERFDPPVMEDETVFFMSLSKKFAPDAIDANSLMGVIGTINSAEITIIGFTLDKWQAKMASIDIRGPSTDRGVVYYEVTYKIKFKAETLDWHHRIANMGYMCLNTSNEQEPITGEGGNRFKKPAALDADGHYVGGTGENTLWIVAATLEESDWSALGLPNVLPDGT